MRTTTHRLRGLLALGLMLASSAALALGLGEIRVKSGPGQPLVAEIPIISSQPGELEQLQARLASPVTFERVGLPRPQGLVNDLNFAVALDDHGQPIIRVTSNAPVDVSAVNFLVEVDWGQGRLVREYSALVAAPGVMAAAEQPYIEAPAAAPADAIIRAPATTAVEPLPPEPMAAAPTPAPAPSPAPVAAPPPPAPVAATVPAPVAPAGPGDTLDPVRRGQTLSGIAKELQSGSPYTLDQTMVALLRANPEAFIDGNINRLKQGAVLRVPQSTEFAQLQESEARALVRSQIAEWRQARRPVPQPVANTSAPAAGSQSAGEPVADARLEIAPPVAGSGQQAGTQSGISAGGEGDMLANEQLQQTREDLAARESEVQELRAQVAELEKLKQQQQKLIAMKDSDLAAAQQQLAQSQGSTGGVPIWTWLGLGLVLAGMVVWGMMQRRQRVAAEAPPRKSSSRFDSQALAAAMPAPADSNPQPANVAEDDIVAAAVVEPERLPPAVAVPARAAAVASQPTWHSGSVATDVRPAPVVASLNPAPAGRDRLELAIAYLDLGDVVTARDLLNEVVAGGDADARSEAEQLLREIG